MSTSANRRVSRLSAVALAAFGGIMGPVLPADADTDAAGLGVCVLRIELMGTAPLVPPGSTTWGVSGGGTCAVTGGDVLEGATVAGTLSGFQDLPTVSCLASLLDGTLTVTVTDYGSFTGDLVVAASAGGAAVLVALTLTSSAAVGVFAQHPIDTALCVTGNGTTTLTWKGALAFAEVEA
jgi:hypothetical protein